MTRRAQDNTKALDAFIAAKTEIDAMLAKGFLQEVDADPRKGEPMWRETGDGHGTTLVATDAGLAAIGIEPEDTNTAPVGADEQRFDSGRIGAVPADDPVHALETELSHCTSR